MADDWDLYAVVRSYAAASSTIDASSTTNQNENENENENENVPRRFVNADDPSDFPGFVPHQEDPFQGLQQIYQEQYEYSNLPANSVVQEQQQQYTPQFSLYQNSQHFVQQQQPQMILGSSSPLSFASATPQPIRSRRRKNQQEKTVHRMTQEELSADTWAWRKYGQKPIKGSPFPRNYYRCSTSKGCVARRQVERCPADPNMYVVSYSGQHSHPRPTHRSSLAGSTRTKSAAKTSGGSGEAAANNTAQTNTAVALSSSPASGSSFSPAAEEGADAENQSAAEAEEEVEGWDDDQDEDDDGDGDDDNGDGEILIPNPFIDHY